MKLIFKELKDALQAWDDLHADGIQIEGVRHGYLFANPPSIVIHGYHTPPPFPVASINNCRAPA
jgi:hypothetical protein